MNSATQREQIWSLTKYSILGMFLLTLFGCGSRKKIEFTSNNIELEYRYTKEWLTGVIERKVKVTKLNTKEKKRFKPDPDIEGYDEVRFYLIEDFSYRGNRYDSVLYFSDGFAIALLELGDLELIYNDHTENPEINEALDSTFHRCIGKIFRGEYMESNCEIEGY